MVFEKMYIHLLLINIYEIIVLAVINMLPVNILVKKFNTDQIYIHWYMGESPGITLPPDLN